ncbi:MAG TPA: hypothetical protein VFB81_12900, partial [Myxococcales bacterium]|nr:hypothetical protein [Myxococcales bacterium]
VTAIGGFTELPPDVVVPVRPGPTEAQLSELLHGLLTDGDRRRALAAGRASTPPGIRSPRPPRSCGAASPTAGPR